MNRRSSDLPPVHDEKKNLQQGLAHHFAINASRVQIIDDARLPVMDGAGISDLDEGADDGEKRRDLILVAVLDGEMKAGQMVQSTVLAKDILDQLRVDMSRGRTVGPISGVEVDAVFINHGDIVLPFEWPTAQSRLLIR